jgi:hypothetical protein
VSVPPGRDPPRWTEGGADGPLGRRAAELLGLPPPPPLGPVRRARIGLRLASRRAPARGWWRARYGLAAAMLTVVVVGAAAAATAGVRAWLRRGQEIPAAEGSPARSAHRTDRRGSGQDRRRPDPQQLPVASPEPPGSPLDPGAAVDPRPGSGATPAEIEAAPARAGAPGRTRPALAARERDGRRQPPQATPRAPSTSPPSSSPTAEVVAAEVAGETSFPPPAPERVAAPDRGEGLPPSGAAAAAPDSEARLVSRALARLHVDGDGAAALALLAEHRRRFPAGALQSEARVAEVQALLRLGRRSQALEVLDRLAVGRLPRGPELAVLRAELRAEARRCPDAIADFDRCADGARCRPDAEERALYGRASCLGKLGQGAAARADLERYLARFPRGRFATAAARALAGAR